MESIIRYATKDDIELILEFIKELSVYEKMAEEVVTTPEMLEKALFIENKAEVIFIMEADIEVGFALFFHNFSTFKGKKGLYLEDLFVKPAYRAKGYGKKLFKALCQIAIDRDCARFEWTCLNWNKPSIDFYLSLGAKPMDEWTVYRLDQESIKKLIG